MATGRTHRGPSTLASQATLDDLMASWMRSLAAGNRSPLTQRTYRSGVTQLRHYLASAHGMDPAHVADISRAHLEGFLAHIIDAGGKPRSAATYHCALAVFFKWCVEEGELEVSPLARIRAPKVAEQPVPVLADEQIARLLKACEGNTFLDRRDRAIVRILLDTGLRRSEIAGLRLADIDLERGEATVTGKGGSQRTVVFLKKATKALDSYLRVRSQHPDAGEPNLWLGASGPLKHWGIYQMLQRRAAAAGLEHIWTHLFRHAYAHQFLAEGGQEGALMRLAGWRNPRMVYRYGAALASERARDAARNMKLGDRL